MPAVRISPKSIALDGQEIGDHVVGYQIHAAHGDVPLVVLELKPGAAGNHLVFEGIANVRLGTEAPTPLEFLEGIDPSVLEEAVLIGDMTKSPIAAALDVLRDLARSTQP